jgi:hypothetical protein
VDHGFVRGATILPFGGERNDRAERGWPRASVRLRRWQRELANGARLRLWDGESHREICARLLMDACTGDLGEVCTSRESSDDTFCEGELLPDGRCREYHFARLPLLPAQPPGR